MAVENKYTNADIVAGKKTRPYAAGGGAKVFTMLGTASVVAADDDGSIYRVFSSVPSNLIPIKLEIANTAITNGTDYDFGLYDVDGGAVVDKDILADGISMASARTIATSNNAGMTTITLVDLKTLAELSAEASPPPAYDIAFTANTVGSADGTIRVLGFFVEG